MAKVAPILRKFEDLERHFDWLIDGSISDVVSKNLVKELNHLNLYLRTLGREDLVTILNEAVKRSRHFPESGNTSSWVGMLRAAEKLWRTTDDYALFRMEEEGVIGASPQIIVIEWNR